MVMDTIGSKDKVCLCIFLGENNFALNYETTFQIKGVVYIISDYYINCEVNPGRFLLFSPHVHYILIST